jgi:2-hydroxychromene-2-carboxylate isomerase
MASDTGAVLDFWFEFASTYSYPAAMRIETVARSAGVAVRWRPFLIGPIFASQGWDNSPFNIYPAKGRYMWRDLERICADLGLPFQRPEQFPQASLLAARAAYVALARGFGAAFCRAVFEAEFGRGLPIADHAVIADIITALGHDAKDVLAAAGADEIKARLRAASDEARRLGLFGAPSFVGAGELFWGNDRLDAAVAWAKARPS